MAPLIAPGVARFTVVGRLQGEDCMNIFDVDIDTGAPGSTRGEECFATAGDILNNWSDHLIPNLVAQYTAVEVRWVDLNSATGTTGSRSSTSDTTWPETGGYTGVNPASNNVYYKVRKNLSGGNRQSRRGVTRLGGVAENATQDGDGNRVKPAIVSDLNAAFEQFKDGINGSPGTAIRNLCVVHTVNRQYVGKDDISTFQVLDTVGTIRRRMPGYGT